MTTASTLRAAALAVALTIGLVQPAAPAAAQDGPTLHVYLPTSIKARALQDMLSSDMPGVNVVVFGRIGDFKMALNDTPPDAVLALRPVLDSYRLSVGLQGQLGGSASELYVLMAPGAVGSLTDSTLGTVDLLGRRGTAKYVATLLGVDGEMTIKRVSEPGDLLPLLQLQAADVILLPESAVAAVKSSSSMELAVHHVDGAEVGRPAVSFLDPADRATIETALKGLSPQTTATIGTDSWSAE